MSKAKSEAEFESSIEKNDAKTLKLTLYFSQRTNCTCSLHNSNPPHLIPSIRPSLSVATKANTRLLFPVNPLPQGKKKKKIKKKSPSSVALSPFASACHHHHVILGYLRQPQSSPGAAQSERSCPKPKTKCPQCSPPALTIIPLTSDTARPNTTSTGKQKPFFLDPSFATAGWQLAGIFIHNSLLLPYRVSGQ